MISKEKYELLKKYGYYSSFAIWSSWKNISDISMFDNDDIINSLNDKYIFVALNPAEHPKNDVKLFQNFHSGYRYQKDYKLCFALEGTKYWGSYITDIFKSFRLTKSSELNKMIMKSPELLKKDIDVFYEELSVLDKDVTIIAIGKKTYKYLKKYVKDYKIKSITHYSVYSSKENYKEKILSELEYEI